MSIPIDPISYTIRLKTNAVLPKTSPLIRENYFFKTSTGLVWAVRSD